MKLLLRKNIGKLGIVGDIVDVAEGYGRNYLLPQGLATAPTDANIRALAEARKAAEAEQAVRRAELAAASERLHSTEVTIRARANEDGVLYGSVGRREIAEALNAEGHEVTPEHVDLKEPIRHLDNVVVPVKLSEDLMAEVKVWVVREKVGDEEEETSAGAESEAKSGTEAGADGTGAE